MAKKPLLSIALLCSNHIDMVRRCLDSLVPIMNQLPCELILLDTSTDPAVPPVLAEYTDNITKFKWINDFSAARNETVKRATGEWYLYIDDDEWFEDVYVLVDFFKSGEYKKYGCANYIQRNFHDPDLVHYSDSWASRMIQLTPETHFESKIHEYLVPVPGECKNLNLVANHTGYIMVTDEDRERKYKRNSVLLKEMIDEQPDMLRWRVQLAQEYHVMKMWDEQIAFCLENLEYTKNINNKWDNRDIGTFYAGLVESYTNTAQYEKALEIGEKALKDRRCSELCHGYIYLRFAVVGFRTKNWSLARKALESYFFLDEELAKTPDKRANQEGALLVNEAYDNVPKKRAYSILIAVGLSEGHTKDLHKYVSLLEWDKKVIYAYEPLISVLVASMAELPYEDIFVEVMQLMWNNKELQKKVLAEIIQIEQKSANARSGLYAILSQISAEHWYVWYVKLMVADEKQDTASLSSALQGVYRTIVNVFKVPEEVIEIAKKYGVSQEDLYFLVPFETWKNHLREFIEKSSERDLILLELNLLAGKTQENIRYDYFFARVAEAKVLYHAGEQEFAQKKLYLQNFAEKMMIFLRKYYQETVFIEAPELLPTYAHAAILIERAFSIEEQDSAEMLRILKEVVEIYPSFTSVIRGFITAFGMEQKEKRRRSREEMKQLKEQILVQVQGLIQQGQKEEALSIVEQLKQMQPDDLDVTALALELRLSVLC